VQEYRIRNLFEYLMLTERKRNLKKDPRLLPRQDNKLITLANKVYLSLFKAEPALDKPLILSSEQWINYIIGSSKTPDELAIRCIGKHHDFKKLSPLLQTSLRAIAALRRIYKNYVFRNAQDPIEIEKRKSSQIPAIFFDVVRVPIPSFKNDAPPFFKIWMSFMLETCNFFDGKNPFPLFNEIFNLEQKIQSITQDDAQKETVLLNILREYELTAGYSKTLSLIHPENAIVESEDLSTVYKGILSAEQFLGIISRGEVFNDFGAAPQHGAYSHRLQTYLLGNYFEKNISHFFSKEKLKDLKTNLEAQDFSFKSDDAFIKQIPSIFYRLLGNSTFNDALDWDKFREQRKKLNEMKGQHNVPEELNKSFIWTQLLDRYGYGGFFSVPSSFGFIQYLGGFIGLPVIGKLNIEKNQPLREILSIARAVLQYDQHNFIRPF
jgi:hypothetical protein